MGIGVRETARVRVWVQARTGAPHCRYLLTLLHKLASGLGVDADG